MCCLASNYTLRNLVVTTYVTLFYFASADAWSCYECKIMNASIFLLIYWVHKMKALQCGLKLVNLSNLILLSLVHIMLNTPSQIMNTTYTILPASRSSSVGPEGCFLFFHPKVKVQETISLRSTTSEGVI